MFLDILKSTVNGKTYRYARLLRSVRCPDGRVTHEVVAKLGSLSDLEIENYRAALQASRDGKSVVLAEPDAARLAPIPIEKSLQYLDVAVLMDVWRLLQLPDLLAQLFAKDDARLNEQVLFALVAQRCLAPGSKLSAS